MDRPRVFLSAVTEELRTARRAVAAAVRTLGFDPVSQEDFPTGHGELCQWLREQIQSCEGLIQIVGQAYGNEPGAASVEYGRVSYTQFELFYAKSLGIKTWVIVAGETCERDAPVEKLDLPATSHPDPAAYQSERRKLQADYLNTLMEQNHLCHRASSTTELENLVLRLRDELGELRRRIDRQQTRLVTAMAAVFLGLVVLGGGGWWAYRNINTSVAQGSSVDTERIRAHLRKTAEETRTRELADADRATDWQQRQRLRYAAETSHAARLARIDELAESFALIEGRGGSTIFKEMVRILTEQGVDDAIAYVSGNRAVILQNVRIRAAAARGRIRSELQPLLQAAALCESKGQPVNARTHYADVLAADSTWPAALHAYVWFLINQGNVARIRSTLAEAQQQYDEAHQAAMHLTRVEPHNTEWQHDLSVCHNRLGDVAVAQGRLEDAGRAYGDGLAIRKTLAAAEPDNLEWQRDLLVSYNNIGDVAVARGRLDDAAQAYRSSFALANKLVSAEPDNTHWQRDLLVSHNKVGDVAFAAGKLEDAIRAYEDGAALGRKLLAIQPDNERWQRDLSIFADRLGDAAMIIGNVGDAERVYGEGLTLRKRLVGNDPNNTQAQRDLSISYDKLSDVAVARGDLSEALQHRREALVLRRQLAASDTNNAQWQRDVSISCNKDGDVALSLELWEIKPADVFFNNIENY